MYTPSTIARLIILSYGWVISKLKSEKCFIVLLFWRKKCWYRHHPYYNLFLYWDDLYFKNVYHIFHPLSFWVWHNQCFFFNVSYYFFTDIHSLVQQPPQESWYSHRQHRRWLPQWTQTHASAWSHIRRNTTEARSWQNAISQGKCIKLIKCTLHDRFTVIMRY